MPRAAVTIPITIEARGAQQGARQVESSFRRIEGAAQLSLGRVAKTAARLGAAYLGLSEVRKAVSATEQLGRATLALHRNMGLSVGTASALGAQLIARGADIGRINMAFGTLSRQVAAASRGTKSAVQTFQQLGLSQRELQRLSPDQLLMRVSEGLHRMRSAGAQTAVAMRLFGRGWQVLKPLLQGGAEELRKQLDIARRYGATLGGRSVKSIQDWIAAQREAKLATLGLQVTVGTTLIPLLTRLIGGAAKATAAVRDWATRTGFARAANAALASTLRVVSGAFSWVGKQIEQGTVAGKALTAVLGALLGRALALRAVATVSAVIAGLRGAFTGAAIGARLLNLALGASPIGRVITAASILAGAISLLSARFPGVRRAAQTAMGAVASAVRTAAGVARSAFGAITSLIGAVVSRLRGPFSAAWRVASGVVRTYVGIYSSVFRTYLGVVSRVVGTVAGLLRGAFSAAWRAASSVVKDAVSAVAGAVRAVGGVISRVFGTVRRIVGTVADKFRQLASAIGRVRDLIKGAAGAIGKVAGALNPFGDGPGIGIGAGMPGGRAGLFAAARVAASMGLALTSFVRPGAHTVTGALSYHAVGRAMDFAGPPARMLAFAQLLAATAGPRIKELIYTPLGWGIKDGRVVPMSFFGSAVARQHDSHVHLAMRRGGVVPGRGRGDRVPALLEPGEYVVPREVVERVGADLFEQLRMQRGGRVSARELARIAARAGVPSRLLDEMVAIALAESGGRPGVRGDRGTSIGLWQIHLPAHPWARRMDLTDPMQNARAAARVLREQGLGAWSTWVSGAARRYLATARRAVAGLGSAARRSGRGRGGERPTRGQVGLSVAERLEAARQAGIRAGLTPGTVDDQRAVIAEIEALSAADYQRRRRLAEINRALRGKLRPSTRRRLLEERERLMGERTGGLQDLAEALQRAADLGADPRILRLFAAQSRLPVPLPRREEQAAGETGGGEATGGKGGDRESELAEVMRELTQLTRQQVETQQRLIALTEREGPSLAAAVAAAVNGFIGGQASLLMQSPAFGPAARY